MVDGSKRIDIADGAAGMRAQSHSFLPETPMPRNLLPGPVAIADMANAFGVTHRTLHFYEEKGLIRAGRIGLMRVYDAQDVKLMSVINACREVGMPVAVILELLSELRGATSQEDADGIFHNALMVRKRELISGMSTVRRQMQQITDLLDRDHDDMLPPTNDNNEDMHFTPLERQCLEMMSEGLSTIRVARALQMKMEEAQTLETGIITKFSANNRFQAVAKAVLLGFVRA